MELDQIVARLRWVAAFGVRLRRASLVALAGAASLSALRAEEAAPVAGALSADDFGYVARDEREPGGPVYGFIDISATGTRVTFVRLTSSRPPDPDNGIALNLPLGFPFRFYRATYSAAHMTVNGAVGFDHNYLHYGDNECPISPYTPWPESAIYPLWDDLDLGDLARAGGYYQTFAACPNASGGTGPCTVFMWNDAQIAPGDPDPAANPPFDFEVILYSNGNVLMQYGTGNPDAGAGSTLGIKSYAASSALTYACNEADSIAGGRAVLFEYPGLACSLVPESGEAQTGSAHTVTATVRMGGQTVAAGLPVTFEIIEGPNAGISETVAVDFWGQAAFTYTGVGGDGTDIIQAGGELEGSAFSCSASCTWASPPPNDHCAGAIVVDPTTCSLVDSQNVRYATLESNEPRSACSNYEPCTLWYSFLNDSPVSRRVGVTTRGSDHETCLAVYRVGPDPCDFAAFEEVACNQRISPLVAQSGLIFTAEAGTRYMIQLGTYGLFGGTAVLDLQCLEPAPHDLCADAIAVDDTMCPLTSIWDTSFISPVNEPGEPLEQCAHDAGIAIASVWHTFTNTSGQNLLVRADATKSGFASSVGLFRGESGPCDFDAFNLCRCGPHGTVEFVAEPGAVYTLRVASNSAHAQYPGRGYFRLDVDCEPFEGAPICQLEPASAVNVRLDTPHEVTATVTAGGTALACVPVTFEVIDGPDAGATAIVWTDYLGEARFSYPNTGGAGLDTIEARGAFGGAVFSCAALKSWEPPPSGPPNDHCADAIEIRASMGVFTDHKDASAATVEPGEPIESNASVWYKYQNDTDQVQAVWADASGSSYDWGPDLFVYRVTREPCDFSQLDLWQSVWVRDRSSPFLAEPGGLYMFQFPGAGELFLSVETRPPENLTLQVEQSTEWNMLGALHCIETQAWLEGPEWLEQPRVGGLEVSYEILSGPNAGRVFRERLNPTWLRSEMCYAEYSDPGRDVIRVTGRLGSLEIVHLLEKNWVPINDFCRDAVQITDATCPMVDRRDFRLEYSEMGQLTFPSWEEEEGEPVSSCQEWPSPPFGLWYRLTNTTNVPRLFKISTEGTAMYLGNLGLFRVGADPCDFAQFEELRCDIYASTLPEEWLVEIEPGATRMIRASTVITGVGPTDGLLQLSFDVAALALNDQCADAIAVDPGSCPFFDSQDVRTATVEPGESAAADDRSIWYEFLAPGPEPAFVRVSVARSAWVAHVRVYRPTGGACDFASFELLARSDLSPVHETVFWVAEPGVPYKIQVMAREFAVTEIECGPLPDLCCPQGSRRIPDADPAGLISTITIPDDITIADVDVGLVLSHSNNYELTARLTSPAGTTVELLRQRGGSGLGDACGPAPNYVLDDEAEEGMVVYGPPRVGREPSTGAQLVRFRGENGKGTWTLTLIDSGSANPGWLHCWCLQIEPQPSGWFLSRLGP